MVLVVAVGAEVGVQVAVMMITMTDGIVILIRVPVVRAAGMMIVGIVIEVEVGDVVGRLQDLAVAGSAPSYSAPPPPPAPVAVSDMTCFTIPASPSY